MKVAISQLHESTLQALIRRLWPLESEGDLLVQEALNAELVGAINSDWGSGKLLYTDQPYREGLGQWAGWQSRHAPGVVMLAMLDRLEFLALASFNTSFWSLEDNRQDLMVGQLAADERELALDIPLATAFKLFRDRAFSVLFHDRPEARAVGWKWLDDRLAASSGRDA